MRGLRRLLGDDDLFIQVKSAVANGQAIDWRLLQRVLSGKRIAMLRYGVKLTLEPGSIVQSDIAGLRTAGFSDTDILHVAELVGYFAYVNRIADGLGVMLENPGQEKTLQ